MVLAWAVPRGDSEGLEVLFLNQVLGTQVHSPCKKIH